MLDRSDPDAKAARRRELNTLAKRRQREREKRAGGWFCRLLVTPIMTEAVIAQSEDAGMTKDEAERASRSRKKVTADLNAINGEWAVRYLVERQKSRSS